MSALEQMNERRETEAARDRARELLASDRLSPTERPGVERTLAEAEAALGEGRGDVSPPAPS